MRALQDYAGFNLLVGDRDELWHLNSHSGTVQRLPGGVYGLSNADLDSPWPKLERARAAFTHCLLEPTPEALLELLADRQRAADSELPSTGVPLEWERLLSSIFIASPGYGTRASTALLHHADGRLVVVGAQLRGRRPRQPIPGCSSKRAQGERSRQTAADGLSRRLRPRLRRVSCTVA